MTEELRAKLKATNKRLDEALHNYIRDFSEENELAFYEALANFNKVTEEYKKLVWTSEIWAERNK